jgi:hypothetical protein
MQTNNIFEFLDWILKKKEKEPIYENNITDYILNRWLSMSDFDAAKILNVTVNRWNKCDENSEVFLDNCKFLKTILPKINKKLEYLKKKNTNIEEKEEEAEEDILIKNYEISKRELKLYNNLLDYIKKKDN